jgi:hypothetical protein
MIEEPQVVVHKPDHPDLLADLLDTDVLSSEDDTEIDFPAPDTQPFATGYGESTVVEGVLERLGGTVTAAI